jgi:hypothetical protein
VAHFFGQYSLEYALLWLFDPEVEPTDFPDVDPAEIAVFSFESIVAISAMHEVDGPVRLDLYLDEEPRLDQAPINLGSGSVELFSGRLAVSGSPGLEVVDEFRLAGGVYDFAVHGDSDAFSERVVLHLISVMR